MAVKKVVDLSFAGCGFLGMFHVGVLAAFRQHTDRVRVNHCLGASSGTLAACAAAACWDPAWLGDVFKEAVGRSATSGLGAFSKDFVVADIIKDMFQDLPLDIHHQINGRVHISLTTYSFQNLMVSEFSSKQELQDAITCSCFLPVFSGRQLPSFRGKTFLDGGLSNNLPAFDSETVKISPFSGKLKNISPLDQSRITMTLSQESVNFNVINIRRHFEGLRYMNNDRINEYYDLGFSLADQFLTNVLLD